MEGAVEFEVIFAEIGGAVSVVGTSVALASGVGESVSCNRRISFSIISSALLRSRRVGGLTVGGQGYSSMGGQGNSNTSKIWYLKSPTLALVAYSNGSGCAFSGSKNVSFRRDSK